MSLRNLGAGAASLLGFAMGSPEVVTPGETTIELAASPTQPQGSALLPETSAVATGGITVTIVFGTEPSKETLWTGWAPAAT